MLAKERLQKIKMGLAAQRAGYRSNTTARCSSIFLGFMFQVCDGVVSCTNWLFLIQNLSIS